MSNVAGKAYGMNVITPMPKNKSWINRLLFMFSRCNPKFIGGLLNLSIIHYARWFIIPRDQWPGMPKSHYPKNDYLFFVSNFNGTWDQYVDSFSDGIPNGLDLFWYGNTNYPGSIPITPFKNYIRTQQIDCDYYYNATPGSAQRDIKSALRVWAAIDCLASKHAELNDEQFSSFYAEVTRAIQNNLPSSGSAPIPSLDTYNANRNRQALIANLYAPSPPQ